MLLNRLDFTRKYITKYYDLGEDYQIELMKKILQKIDDFVDEKDSLLFMFYITENINSNLKLSSIRDFADLNNIGFKVIPLVPHERINGVGHWNDRGHHNVTKIVIKYIFNDDNFIERIGKS